MFEVPRASRGRISYRPKKIFSVIFRLFFCYIILLFPGIPRSWSSRVVADEDYISVEGCDTVPATMNTLVEQECRSMDGIDGAVDVLNKMHAQGETSLPVFSKAFIICF